jgi:transposase InsO family protein
VDAAAVNTRWCGDITDIWTWEGWLYQDTSSDYALLAGDLEVRLSTGRTGQCWDNALTEPSALFVKPG